MSLAGPILESGPANRDPCKEAQINASDQYRRKLLNLQILRRILTAKPWLSVGQ
jgi:hypothetical protein